MHLVLIGLAMGIFLHDAPTFGDYTIHLPIGGLIALVLTPKLLIAGMYWWACWRAYGKLNKHDALRSMKRLNLATSLLPIAALGSYALDLWAGALTWIRDESGQRDFVLLDEAAIMMPTLAVLAWSWWAYYPIDKRMREATILRRADMGLPIYPVWSRTQYVVTQARNQFALILGPVLAIMAWSECLTKLRAAGWLTESQQLGLTPVGAGVVFLCAPLLIRRLWDTVPLPPGEVRDKMLALCDRHQVKVRELLLWRSFGGMINAAVMGLFGRLRFILLSDGLLDQVEEHEVEAVMAHELAHVRLKHLWWLLISALSGVAVLSAAGEVALRLDVAWPTWSGVVALMVGLGLWVLMFGWVSRRIERQADTFAARHMVGTFAAESQAHSSPPSFHPEDTPAVFTAQAVHTMTGALQRVADLNHISTARRSWRHGSIAWRQAYLRGLIGQPLQTADVDRQVFWIKAVSLTLLIAAIAFEILAT